MKKLFLLGLQLLNLGILLAQETGSRITYDPKDFYLPSFNPPQGNLFRSANGTPGPMYWQNRADYVIHATLSERDTSIAGTVTITYTNNSPDKLDYLWLQLEQNLFTYASRGTQTAAASDVRWATKDFTHGIQVANVAVTHMGKTYSVKPEINDTRMQVRLKNPVSSKGGVVTIKINYEFTIPEYGSDRMGRMHTDNGEVYEIAQWYPRMCVYDDLEGWNTLPYTGKGEFYCEYGNIDYYVTAPAAMFVFGSGDLINPSQVLTAEEIRRLAVASKSDQPVYIVKADEVGKPGMRPTTKADLTWHFKMTNTRDVAFAASKGMVWSAARINLPSGRKAMAMSAFPPESDVMDGFKRSTEYLKTSVEMYSEKYFEYPWNTAYSIGGPVAGMEYPGLTFNGYLEKNAYLWMTISHEIGHSWYPMIVGSNERKYPWQDEGVNTFINLDAINLFNKGEYAKDPYSSEKFSWAILNIDSLPFHKQSLMMEPMTKTESLITGFGTYYNKTAYGLKLLQYHIVGKERFDYAFKKYTEAWAYKHPSPYDFFNCINNAAGEDLNWFWKEWFFTNWTLDQAITSVTYVDNDPGKGALITIENKGKMILPVFVKVQQSNGETGLLKLPVEIWQQGETWLFKYPSISKIDRITLDPENILPDVNRENNSWNNSNN